MTLDPRLVAAALPAKLRESAASLAYAPDAYFLIGDKTTIVPLERLRLSRARPEGIASAVVRMAEAAGRKRARRAPVSVRLREDGLLEVTDGNSTVVIAAAAGWPDLPCMVEVTIQGHVS